MFRNSFGTQIQHPGGSSLTKVLTQDCLSLLSVTEGGRKSSYLVLDFCLPLPCALTSCSQCKTTEVLGRKTPVFLSASARGRQVTIRQLEGLSDEAAHYCRCRCTFFTCVSLHSTSVMLGVLRREGGSLRKLPLRRSSYSEIPLNGITPPRNSG